MTETIKDTIDLNSPLARLCQNRISGEEVVGLLQKYGIISQLQRELIVDNVIKSIELTAEEVLGGYKAFYQQHQINSDEDRADWLECNHVTLPQFEHFVLRTLKLDRFKRETFASKVDSYFLERKNQLDRASYTVLGVKSFHLAQELFLQVQDGEADLSDLIKQYSGGEADETNGLRGPHELSIPHPILATQLRSLKPGQLAPPLQIAKWFIVVRLEKYFPVQLDEKTRMRLIDELYESMIHRQLHQSIEELKI
ncbi:peptidylprolyl isomerase [Chamaesiphon sp.]|uniref:peptidylprolyl isomerase n=1 Tax=Chamaesiphon sp. TaxID=2814140 RepID=UPI00359442EB